MKLTTEQTKILNLNSGQHLVLAPPGTGKTELLTQRITSAITNGVDPKKMACLTFTNRAAQNMQDRVGEGNGEVFIGNIHSFCNIYLRKNNLIPQNTSLLDEEDALLLLKEAESLTAETSNKELEKQESLRTQEHLESLESLLRWESLKSLDSRERLYTWERQKRWDSFEKLKTREIEEILKKFDAVERLERLEKRGGFDTLEKLETLAEIIKQEKFSTLEKLKKLKKLDQPERADQFNKWDKLDRWHRWDRLKKLNIREIADIQTKLEKLENLPGKGKLEKLEKLVGKKNLEKFDALNIQHRLESLQSRSDRLARMRRLGSIKKLKEVEAREGLKRLEALRGRRQFNDEDAHPCLDSISPWTKESLIFQANIKRKNLSFSDKILFKAPESFLPFLSESGYRSALSDFGKYEELKKELNSIDFDDLLTLTYHHLCEAVAPPMFDWLQVDEVQDLNPLQWAIIDKISSLQKSHRVFFGDYEQSIFSFMGANLEVLDEVRSKSELHELQSNFRSPQYLLDLYNKYALDNLKPNWTTPPHSENNEGKEINSLVFQSVNQFESDEITWIVEKKLPKEPKGVTAILVKTNKTADMFAIAFDKKGLGYFKISGFDLFRRSLIKDIMAYLTVIIDDNDRRSWSRMLKVYGRVKTLKESRPIICAMFECGIKPFDFLELKNQTTMYLDGFLTQLEHSRVVVFDTETTGLDTKNDDIIQIAAVELVNGKPGTTFEVFIDTDKDLTESEKIHKIPKKHLVDHGLEREKALQSFLEFIGDSTILAHNLEYDVNILNANLGRCGLGVLPDKLKAYDSIEIAKRLYPRLPLYKLEYLLDYLNIEGENSHNALDDVKATSNLILSFIEPIKANADSRKAFISQYSETIMTFNSNLSPIHNALSGRFSDHMHVADIIDTIASYMSDHLHYPINENEYNELGKLTKHMNAKCKVDEAIANLKKYIPEYSKYNESDLILGNEKIIIATIHKAKGLEFENVIIPGCTSDNFPGYYSRRDNNEDEDARLLYVAMTRAEKRLLITCHTAKKLFRGQILHVSPSKFLEPIMSMMTGGMGMNPATK
jgi:DNA helicase-2/ATP-dependent DNA helicase PcrA